MNKIKKTVVKKFVSDVKDSPVAMKIISWTLGILIALVSVIHIGEKLVFASFFFGGAKTEMAIPGLWKDFVPQGFDKLETGEYLMSGYAKDGVSPTSVYVVNGKKKTRYQLYNQDGSAYTSHAGGITHFNNYVYIANDTHEDITYLDMFLLSDLLDGDEKATLVDSIAVPNRLAYCSVYNGKMYTGAFYREGSVYLTPDAHHLTTPSGETNTALMFVYDLNAETGKFTSETPEMVYSTTSNIQGMCMTDSGKIVLSTSWGLSKSKLYVYDTTTSDANVTTYEFTPGVNVPLVYLCESNLTQTVVCPPMAEELVYENGRVLILTESASMKYIFGKIMSGNFVHSFPIA